MVCTDCRVLALGASLTRWMACSSFSCVMFARPPLLFLSGWLHLSLEGGASQGFDSFAQLTSGLFFA